MKPEIITLAEILKETGFVVYLSENQNYGIFTDDSGKRVVYFQYDRLEGYQFSGTYKANQQCGTGWGLRLKGFSESALLKALYQMAPNWVTQGYKPSYQTLESYLKDNKHSRYYLF